MYTTLLSKMSVYELARQIELKNYNTNNKKNSKNKKQAASLSNKSNIVGTSECRCEINSNPRTMRRLWSICERGYLLLYAERVQCSVTLINLPSNLFKLNGRTGMIQYYNEDLEKYGKVLIFVKYILYNIIKNIFQTDNSRSIFFILFSLLYFFSLFFWTFSNLLFLPFQLLQLMV